MMAEWATANPGFGRICSNVALCLCHITTCQPSFLVAIHATEIGQFTFGFRLPTDVMKQALTLQHNYPIINP